MSEYVTLIAPDGSEKIVLLNYDTWASHSSVSKSLDKYISELNYEGDLVIQQFGSIIPQKETYTGLVNIKQMNKKFRCMVNRQELHTIERQVVEVPKQWQEVHNEIKLRVFNLG